jgi:hypothetical protein
MKNRSQSFAWIMVVLIILSFSNCKKSKTEEPATVALDYLSDAEVAELNTFPVDSIIKFSNILFDDSTSMQAFLLQYDSSFYNSYPLRPAGGITLSLDQKRRLLISEMVYMGFYLTIRKVYPADQNGPYQYGLAYSWGSKQYMTRQLPAPVCNSEKIYGLDCSGMMYQIAVAPGLAFPSNPQNYCNAQYLKDTANWDKAINGSQKFTGLKMSDLGYNLPLSQICAGDIIVWFKNNSDTAKHIGIACTNGSSGALLVLNSSGGSKTCATNMDPLHGPVIKVFTTMLSSQHYNNYKVLRVINPSPDPDGNWLVTCTIEYCDSATVSKVLTVSGGNFNATIGTYTVPGCTETISIQGSITYTTGDVDFVASGNEFLTGSCCNGGNGFQGFINIWQNPQFEGDSPSYWGNIHWKKL